MKKVIAIILVSLLMIVSLSAATYAPVEEPNLDKEIMDETRSVDLPTPESITFTLTVDILQISQLDDLDPIPFDGADWYYRIKTTAESNVKLKTSTIPIFSNTDDINPVPISERYQESITLSNPLSPIEVDIRLWEDDGAGTGDDVADISPVSGGGAADYGGNYPYGPGGSGLVFNYYVLRQGALTDHRYQDELLNWRSMGTYYWYSGEGAPDSSTSTNELDAKIYLAIFDTYSDSTGPPAPTISSSTHTENVWSTNDDPFFTWSTPSDLSGVYGYSYVWDTSPSTIPDTTSDTTGNSRSYSNVVNGGSYYFHVRARDNANNWGSTDHFGPVKIDDALPNTPSPNDGITGWSNDNTPTFTWTAPSDPGGSGVSGYYWKVDSGSDTWTTSTSRTVPAQSDGSHTFYVKVKDNAGNIGSYGSHSFSIDTSVGNPSSLSDGVFGWSNDNTPTFAWTWPSETGRSGIDGYYWKVDSGSDTWVNSATASKTLSAQSSGSHTFYVKAKDNAGNTGSYASHTFQIDTTSPGTPTISSSTHPTETTWYSDSNPSFSWTSTGGPSPVTYYYELDNPAPSLSKTGTTHSETNVPDGTHTFYVKATDTGGSSSTDSYTVKIDTTSPNSAVDGLSATQTSTSFLVSWAGSDTNSGLKWYDVQYKEGTGAWTDWITQATNTSGVFNGQDGNTYYFRSRAEDNASNLEAYPVTEDTSTTIDVPLDIGWIEGYVYESDGTTSIPDVTVSIESGSSALTDVSGHYNISASPGGYTVNASKSGYDTDTKIVSVTTGQTTNQDFILTIPTPPQNEGWLEGYVYNGTGTTPISGATISVNGNTTTADSNGYYNISLSAGSYTADASKNGYESDSKPVTIDQGQATEQDFSLIYIDPSQQGWAVGYVYETGASTLISGATVTVTGGPSDITDSNGYYNITLGAGGYTLTITKAGYSSDTDSVTVIQGQETTTNFYLTPNPVTPTDGTIEGYVFIYGTSTPINGATVQIQNGASVASDSTGYYSLTVAGTHSITASKDGYSSDTKSVTVTAGQVTTRDFYLTPSGDDIDSDGLSDAWERTYFGNLDQDADDDPDNDGLTNLQEYSMDTEPDNDDTDGDGLKDGDDPNPLVADTTDTGTDDEILKNPLLWLIIALVASAIIGTGLYSRKKKPPAEESQDEELTEPED